jgi:glycosyltransferase involved in cell wall biosynthesis
MIDQIAAVVPCQNEAKSIEGLVAGLLRIGVQTVIVSVDPLSSDGTAEVAAAAGAIVVSSTVSGYDGPVLTGVARASATRASHVLFLDAGRKYDLDSIGALLAAADPSADMTFGIRDAQQFWHQKLGNNLFKVVLKLRFGGSWVQDVSSVRLIRTEVIPKLQLEDREFSLPFQTVVHALKQGMRIDYFPIRCTVRVGVSKVSGNKRNSAKAAKQMLLCIAKAPKF